MINVKNYKDACVAKSKDFVPTLKELKKAVKYKCEERVDKLKEKIKLIEMQMYGIDLEFDEQENRDDKITEILSNE